MLVPQKNKLSLKILRQKNCTVPASVGGATKAINFFPYYSKMKLSTNFAILSKNILSHSVQWLVRYPWEILDLSKLSSDLFINNYAFQ